MGTRLKELRGNRSQTQVQEGTGVRQSTLSDWEKRPPRALQDLAELARYYGVSSDYLLGLTDSPLPVDNKKSPNGLGEVVTLYNHMSPRQQWQMRQISYILCNGDRMDGTEDREDPSSASQADWEQMESMIYELAKQYNLSETATAHILELMEEIMISDNPEEVLNRLLEQLRHKC